MKNKLHAILRIIKAKEYFVLTETGMTARRIKDNNSNLIKTLIETFETTKGEMS